MQSLCASQVASGPPIQPQLQSRRPSSCSPPLRDFHLFASGGASLLPRTRFCSLSSLSPLSACSSGFSSSSSSSFRSCPRLKLKATSASGFLRLCCWFAPSSRPRVGVGSGRAKEEHCSRRCSAMAASRAQDVDSSVVSRRVTIVNTSGEKLAGLLDDTKSKELVVLCHGFRSSKDSNTLGGIAAAILKSGISTFRFDFAGNGESEGQFAYGNYWRETEDLRSVILHWRAEGRQVTAIVGHSKGGNVVVLYASKYGDVSTVINVSGRFDLTAGMEARFGKNGRELLQQQGFLDVKNKLTGEVEYRVTLKSLEDRLATDMNATALSISKDVRTLTIHGEVDEVVPASDAYEFAKRISNHVLKIVPAGNHNYEKSREELSTLVVEFLEGKLSKI